MILSKKINKNSKGPFKLFFYVDVYKKALIFYVDVYEKALTL
jgi:hypothetical protein